MDAERRCMNFKDRTSNATGKSTSVIRSGYLVTVKKALIFIFRRHETAQDKAHNANDERTPEGGLEPLYAKTDMHAFGKP
jgi:hypothetical protein